MPPQKIDPAALAVWLGSFLVGLALLVALVLWIV